MSNGIDWKTALDAIHEHFRSTMRIDVIWTSQPRMPQPLAPLGTLQRQGPVKKLHTDSVVKTYDAAINAKRVFVTGQREFRLQAQVYSDDISHEKHAISILTRALDAFEDPSRVRKLKEANVAVIQTADVLDLSAISGANWQSRASLEVVFRTTSNREDDSITTIDRVSGSLKLKRTPDDVTPIDFNVDTGDPNS